MLSFDEAIEPYNKIANGKANYSFIRLVILGFLPSIIVEGCVFSLALFVLSVKK